MESAIHPELRKWMSGETFTVGVKMEEVMGEAKELGMIVPVPRNEALENLIDLQREERKKETSDRDMDSILSLVEFESDEDGDEEENEDDAMDEGSSDEEQQDANNTAAHRSSQGYGTVKNTLLTFPLEKTQIKVECPIETDVEFETVSSATNVHTGFRFTQPEEEVVAEDLFCNVELPPQLPYGGSGQGQDGGAERGEDMLYAEEEEEWAHYRPPYFQEGTPRNYEELMQMGVKSNSNRRLADDTKFSEHNERAMMEKVSQEDECLRKVASKITKRMGPASALRRNELDSVLANNSSALLTVAGEAYHKETTCVGKSVSMLIPPIPDADQTHLKTLGVLICNSTPTSLIWKSNNAQHQLTEDAKFNAERNRGKKRLIDYATEQPGLVSPMEDFIVQVSVYFGHTSEEVLPIDIKVAAEPVLLYKLELLGSNTVGEFRRKLCCEKDIISTKEVQHPDDPINPRDIVKNKITTWMMLLGDTLYQEGFDYLSALKQWAATGNQKNVAPLKVGDCRTKMRDLTLRLGYPYVYCHVGKCEHIIVFNAIRTIVSRDDHLCGNYPRIASNPAVRSSFCRVDNDRIAKWAVMDSDKFPEDPMHLCTRCLNLFCYKDGNKAFPFRLFPLRQLASEL